MIDASGLTEKPNPKSTFDLAAATLGDIEQIYTLSTSGLPLDKLEEVNLYMRRILKSLTDGLSLHTNPAIDEDIPYDAIRNLPRETTLPDQTREELKIFLNWLNTEFGFKVT